MSIRRLTDQQIAGLLRNPNVSKCSSKSITYSKEFKILAVRKYREEWMSPKQIFKEANFDMDVIGKDTPKRCLRGWKNIFKVKGVQGLSIDTRGRSKGGGRPKTRGLTDADRIKRLEIENAYLKAENDFLAKLRAKQAE